MSDSHSKEELEYFRKNPDAYHSFRHKIEGSMNSSQLVAFVNTTVHNDFRILNEQSMREKLATKPEIVVSLMPKFPPGCRRLTPGPGYLEALVKPNVNFISESIKKITGEGIETVDGTLRKVDLIICATGFDTSV